MRGEPKVHNGNTDAGAKEGGPSFGLVWEAITTPSPHILYCSFVLQYTYIFYQSICQLHMVLLRFKEQKHKGSFMGKKTSRPVLG